MKFYVLQLVKYNVYPFVITSLYSIVTSHMLELGSEIHLN
jgi:hypothetical protein